MKITIAQQGWAGSQAAKSLEEVRVGLKLPWIELDGVRLTDITAVEFRAAADEFSTASMTVELLGPVEVVYVDKDGQPLGEPVTMTAAEAIAAGRIDHTSMIDRPGPIDA